MSTPSRWYSRRKEGMVDISSDDDQDPMLGDGVAREE
jgi:hypothetical protein